MTRLFLIFLGFLLLVGNGSIVWAESAKATALRKANGLAAYTPPEQFLSGNFVADEMNPSFIFGSVKNFVSSRKYPTTWLIDARDQNPGGPGGLDQLAEHSLFLEEDCPDKVINYVFINQSGMTPQQWIDWRGKFHGKSKTEPEFAEAKSKLETASNAGYGIGAELRFIQNDGELVGKSPEEYLLSDLKFAPIYDLKQQKKIP